MVLLEGGEFLMGEAGSAAYPADGEGPVRRVRVDPFWIDPTAVSNRDFARFVEETGVDSLAVAIGIPMGILAALKKGTALD